VNRRRAFTLLEVLLALAILAGFAVVILDLRTRSASTAQTIREAQASQRGIDALFTMLTHRTLGTPEPDPETGEPIWTGILLGEPYRVTRERAILASPITLSQEQLAALGETARDRASVRVWRYTLTHGKHTEEVIWHR
jgi:prepilin-type N-terminal cleavage/methylation domain-containing protein